MLLCVPCIGNNDYHPFVKDGKKWVCQVTYDDNVTHDYAYFIQGDTVIGSMSYKKLYKQENIYEEGNVSSSFYAAIREEKRKVYIAKDGNKESKLYDFDNTSRERYIYEDFYLIDRGTPEYISVRGETRMRFFCTLHFVEDDPGIMLLMKWIEGVGCSEDPFEPDNWYGFLHDGKMVACYEDKESVFLREDFDAPTIELNNITVANNVRFQNIYLFDLQGRRLNAVPTRGLYVKDGKKYVK